MPPISITSTGPHLRIELAADPAPISALAAVLSAVEQFAAAAAWPFICQPRDPLAVEVC